MVLVIEILHTFSKYLETVVLIPQFVLLYRRKKYETWVLLFTILLGAESVMRGMPQLLDWKNQQHADPYGKSFPTGQITHYVVDELQNGAYFVPMQASLS